MTKDEAIAAAKLLKAQERDCEGPGREMFVQPYPDHDSGAWHVLIGWNKHAGVVCETPFDVILGWHSVDRICRAIAEGIQRSHRGPVAA